MIKAGHSRLLKYIINDIKRTAMDEPTVHKLVIEDFKPSLIESELPSDCPIRQNELKANEALTDDLKVETGSVVTINGVLKEETLEPAIRTIQADKTEDELKSKIPVPSFRRVKNKNKESLQVPQPKPRGDISVITTQEETPNNENNRNTVQDFDRLFQEINNNERITSMDLEVLRNITSEDPENVDGFFEDIIHAYEEKKKEISLNTDTDVDNKSNPQIQVNKNFLEENNNSSVVDTPTLIINNFDQILNNYSQNNQEPEPTHMKPIVTIYTETVETVVPLNNEVIKEPISVEKRELAEPIVPLNNELVTQPINMEAKVTINTEKVKPIVPLNNEVIKEPINVENTESAEPIVPFNNELVTQPINMEPIVTKYTETSVSIVPLNNEVIIESINVENTDSAEPIVPLNNELVTQPINMEAIDTIISETSEPIVLLNNEVINEPINMENTESAEPIVPLNNELVTQPINLEAIVTINTDTVEPIDPLNNEVIIEPINVENTESAEPIVPFNNELVIQPINLEAIVTINTETVEPIVPLNNEVIIEPINVENTESVEPIVPLNNELVTQPINMEAIVTIITETSEPIVPLNNEVIKEPINVKNMESAEPIVPLNNELVTQPINMEPIVTKYTETSESIVPLNNEVIIESINVENTELAEPIVPLNNDVVTQPINLEAIVTINTETVEPIVPLNNEVIIEPINVENMESAEPIVPLNNELVTQPIKREPIVTITTETSEPIVPLNNEVIKEPINVENMVSAEPIVPLNNELVTQPIKRQPIVTITTETSEPIVPLNNEVIIEPINVENMESAEPIVPLNNELVTQPIKREPIVTITTETSEPIVPLNNEVIKESINVDSTELVEPIVPLNNETVTAPINMEPIVIINTETSESIVALNNDVIIESINAKNTEAVELIEPIKTEEIIFESNKDTTLIVEPVAPKIQHNVIVVENFQDLKFVPLVETIDTNPIIQKNENEVVFPSPHNELDEVNITEIKTVIIEPVTVNEIQKIVDIKADYVIIENNDESAHNKFLNEDVIIINSATEQNNLKSPKTSQLQQNENNFKDTKPTRIPRRFNNNIKIYPTTDESNIKEETVKSNENEKPTIMNDAQKIQSIFKTMKSYDEDKYVNKSNDIISYSNIKSNPLEPEKASEKKRPNIISVIEKNTTQDDIKTNNRENINKVGFKYMPIDNEITSKFRKKSVAETDLGDKIKGRVGSLVQRMTSIENSKHAPKHLIHKVEVPKKQSVLERIAMFERKAELTKMETSKDKYSRAYKQPEVLPEVKTEEMYKNKIEELKNAKNTYGQAPNMPVIELNNGQLMPVLAVGTALLEPVLTKYVIEAAIDLGYRAIDTAFIYGNERVIGEAIKAKIDDGTVTREELFIINKLWSTFHKPELVEKACTASLQQLGLDYFDLYLIHAPMSFKEGKDVVPKIANVVQYSTSDYLDAWRSMETLVKKGLTRNIGVSNFNSHQLIRVLEKGTIKPVVNQVESHPYLNQLRLNEFCTIRDIRLSCFATLGSKGTPKDLKSSELAVVDDPLVKVLAAAIGKTPAQMLIRYQLEHERNVVVKTSSAAHLWDNLQALTFKLTTEEIDALNALNKNKRYFGFIGMGDTHKDYPFTIPF